VIQASLRKPIAPEQGTVQFNGLTSYTSAALLSALYEDGLHRIRLPNVIPVQFESAISIKPGMTRAELLKVFITEGGLWTGKHRTFVYHRCPYIKVDVDFTLSDPDQNVLEERPTDTISNISKPYLDWGVID
jgi:hypothetical protein